MPILSLACLCLLALASAHLIQESEGSGIRTHPVILFPGLSGSPIDARLNKTSSAGPLCAKHHEWYRLWLTIHEMIPSVLSCFLDNFRLVYNPETGRTENPPGVETRVPGFGETDVIEQLSWLPLGSRMYFFVGKTASDPVSSLVKYYYAIVESLCSIGYVRGKTVRGAPYDWRRAPYENEEYLQNVTKLIEEMYQENGETPVLLICHSMGCLYSYYILRQQSQQWKDKHVKSWITLAAPFGGSASAVYAVAAGDNYNVMTFPKAGFKDLESSFSSLAFLMPSPMAFQNTVIFSYKENYTAQQIPQIYQLINQTNNYEMWKSCRKLLSDFSSPGVRIHCLRGTEVPTPENVVYPEPDSFPFSPVILNGDGDGTVNKISADVCLKWSSTPGFTEKEFRGVSHIEMARNKDVVRYVTQRVLHANFDLP